MKNKKRKRQKPYDYRTRVLAVRTKPRPRIEGTLTMATSAAHPITPSGATTPVATAPAAAESEIPPSPNAAPPEALATASGAASPPSAETKADDQTAGANIETDESRAASTASSIADGVAEKAKSEAESKKVKAEPETLEQLIEYAYSRKGLQLSLKPKVQTRVARNARLDDAALTQLLKLAEGDTMLAVPRQILLLSQELKGFPILQSALTDFVSKVMLSHPAYSDTGVQGALRDWPAGLQPADALTKVAAYEPTPGRGAEPQKVKDLGQMRINAIRLFVTWLAVARGQNIDDLVSLMVQTIWQPAATALVDDNARLRALTEIGQSAGFGVVCQWLRRQAKEGWTQHDQAQREAASLRERLTTAETQLTDTAKQLEAARVGLQNSCAESDALRDRISVDRTLLQHELEQLRGRLVKCLTDSADMLEVGLSALRREDPRVQVMLERAEQVVDALKAEIRELRQE